MTITYFSHGHEEVGDLAVVILYKEDRPDPLPVGWTDVQTSGDSDKDMFWKRVTGLPFDLSGWPEETGIGFYRGVKEWGLDDQSTVTRRTG